MTKDYPIKAWQKCINVKYTAFHTNNSMKWQNINLQSRRLDLTP